MPEPVPYARAAADGLRLRVKVTPKAARDGIGGIWGEADTAALKIAVTAPAEGGKANAAVIKLLAKAWGLAKSDISVLAGATDRRKTLLIAGDAGRLMTQLRRWAASSGQ